MDIISLFPIAVGKFHDHSLSSQEKKFIMEQEEKYYSGKSFSKNFYLLDKEELKDLKVYCENRLNEYFQKIYSPKKDIRLYITQSWMSICKAGESHHLHFHPNSFVSGIYYVNVSENDSISFTNRQERFYEFERKSFNIYNSHAWNLPVRENELILFPSNLPHEVEKIKHNKKRVSLAFNSFLKGSLGDPVSFSELIL